MGLIEFTPDHISGLSAWYKPDSLIQQKEPQEISGLQMWFRANDLAKQTSPNQISGITAWYRADQGLTQAGGAVSRWADIMGNTNHDLIQNVAVNKPVFSSSDPAYNNQAIISFTAASSQNLTSSTWTVPSTATIIIIGNNDNGASQETFIDGSDGANRWIIDNNVTANGLRMYQSSGVTASGVTLSSASFIAAVMKPGDVSGSLYSNGNLAVSTGSVGTATTPTSITVGSNYASASSGFLNGKIAEIAIFNRALTQVEIQSIYAYASARYGITIKIGLWTDNTGNGNNATQATQANQPTLILPGSGLYGNQAFIESTGTGPYLSVGPFTGLIPPVTIFAVGETSNVLLFGINGGTNEIYLDAGAGGWRLGNDTSNFTSTYSNNTPSIITAIANGASSSLWIDAITSTLTGTVGSQALDRFGILGSNTGTGTGAAKVAEIAVFNRVLTQAEIQGLHMYATAKYGIALSIGQWGDSTNSGDPNMTASQATQSKQPTLTFQSSPYNKRPVLNLLHSASQTLHTGAWSTPLTSPYTIIVVGNDDGTASPQEAYFDNQTSGPEVVLRNLSGAYDLYQGGTHISGGIAASSSPNVFVCVLNSASSALYVSQRSATGGMGSLTSVNLTGLTFGALYDDSNSLNGAIAEVIVYNKALNTTEIDQILGYCGNKYHIWISN